jgi:O-antigen/teichoic acid export membrane protein
MLRLQSSRQGGFLALCDQGVVSITNFATAVIVGRVCGKSELGTYTLAWTLMVVATGVSGMLTTTPYIVFGPHMGTSRRRRYLGSILVHQCLLSVLCSLAIVVTAMLASGEAWFPVQVAGAVETAAAVLVFVGLREFVRGVNFAELQVRSALGMDLVACTIQALGIFLLFHFNQLTASRVFLLVGLSSAIAAVSWVLLHLDKFRPNLRFYVPDLKRNWNFAQWVLGSGVLSHFARYLYPWMLAAFHGTSITGIWAACSTIVALGNPVFLGLGNYTGPKTSIVYAASGVAAMQRYTQGASLRFAALLLPIVLVLLGFGENIVTGVYGKSYAGTAGVVALLGLNMLISAMTYPYSLGLFTLERPKIDMFVNVLWVVLLVSAGVAMVKSFGLLGAAAAMLGSTSVTAAVRIGVFAREVRQREHSPVCSVLTDLCPPS